MIKKITDLDKEEKISLLRAIASGEINRDCLAEGTLCATEYKDFFLGLLIASSQVEDKKVSIVLLGDSRRAREHLFPRNNG